jgi:CRP/FNR family transcriptional regulator
LAHFLLDISQRMRDRGESAHEFRLSMARYDIANYLGLAVETVSRLFKRLEEQGLIVANRHRVRLMDMDGLHHVIAGGYVERRQEKPVVMTAAV